MTSHELGNELENICKEYLKSIFAKANPQIIETKKGIHGIDFAVSCHDDKEIFIVEVKSKGSQLGKNQMTSEWIEKNLSDELKTRIKKTLENNGIVKPLVFRVDKTDPENPKVNRSKCPTKEFHLQNILKTSETLKQNNNMEQHDYDYQIELLGDLDLFLQGFIEKLDNLNKSYLRKANELREQGKMSKEIHSPFVTNYVETTLAEINKIIENINDRDRARIQKIIAIIEDQIQQLNN